MGSEPTPESKREVTDLLLAWRGGDGEALPNLLPLVYRQLKRIAARFLRGKHGDQTLRTTALVHEAYLRLVDLDRVQWADRTHFYAVTARLMRRILVDQARYRHRQKRGNGAVLLPLDEARDVAEGRALDLLAVDDALKDLSKVDAEMARIVELRYFGGLNREEIAEVLGTSSATVTRRWRSARAWLSRHLQQDRADRIDAEV
ncbi:MAG: sigma-70 family RNA polymerase sigma factor [Acidobacteriota bacterium]